MVILIIIPCSVCVLRVMLATVMWEFVVGRQAKRAQT
jgi:hypothetical protein